MIGREHLQVQAPPTDEDIAYNNTNPEATSGNQGSNTGRPSTGGASSGLDNAIDAGTVAVAGVTINNEAKMVYAQEGQTPAEIAQTHDVGLKYLLKYNEQLSNGNQQLQTGTRVYLQPKRSSYRGKEKFHTVKDGETMFDISQRYGVRMSSLYKKNRMPEGGTAGGK